MSVLPVRNNGVESRSRLNIRHSFGSLHPMRSMPSRIPSSEAAGMKLRNTSVPRMRSRLSYRASTVFAVGMPSKNSSLPMEVSTSSGVMIDFGIGVLNPGGVTASWAPATDPPPSERIMAGRRSTEGIIDFLSELVE